MPRALIAAVLSVTMVLTLSACGESKAELLKELDDMANENSALLNNNQILAQELTEATKEKDKVKYERDAFLEENLELRAEKKILEQREKSLEETLGIIFTMTSAYREDLMDIEDYISTCPDLPSFNKSISESHQNLMNAFFSYFRENLRLHTQYLVDIEPILFILHVDTMKPDELHRPARENCTYYKVAFYQSLVDDNGQDETAVIPRGFSDGFITHWLIEIEEMEKGPAVTVFEPNV